MIRRHPARFYILMIIVPLIGSLWLIAAIKKGQFTIDASGATMIVNTRPADGETGVLPNAFISADLSSGKDLDVDTIDSTAIRLYRTSDGMPVAAVVNTSAAADDLVLQPQELLDSATSYTFETTDSLKDKNGEHVLPFKMTFTTAAGDNASAYPVAFDKIEIPGDNENYTALTIGPGHRLFAATADGKIMRYDLGADGRPTNSKVIQTVVTANQGPRLIMGIRFDPQATAENPILWVSHGQLIMTSRGEMAMEGATDWTGKISVLSGADLSDYHDVVINLPRSFRDHLNNQIDFGPDGALYFCQGSHTAMGAPDPKWGTRGEQLLSAAVLRVDVNHIKQAIDVKTADGGKYDPFAPNAPLTIYASGVRVGFDMLWHSNGHLYTAINGSAAGGNVPSTPPRGLYPKRIDEEVNGSYKGPNVSGVNVPETQDDMLLKIDAGGYYGHPNPLRAEYVLNGGNPSSRVDPFEVKAYPVGTKPDRNWHPPTYSFGKSVSPNGLLEYKGMAFGGMLTGKLLITRFSGGKDIMVLGLDADGEVSESISGISGLTQFMDPLDLCEDISNGFIYVAELKGRRLTLLKPIEDRAKASSLSGKVFRQRIDMGVTMPLAQ